MKLSLFSLATIVLSTQLAHAHPLAHKLHPSTSSSIVLDRQLIEPDLGAQNTPSPGSEGASGSEDLGRLSTEPDSETQPERLPGSGGASG